MASQERTAVDGVRSASRRKLSKWNAHIEKLTVAINAMLPLAAAGGNNHRDPGWERKLAMPVSVSIGF